MSGRRCDHDSIGILYNQKGGCAKTAKTVTFVNLGIGLAREGKHALLVDVDAQGLLTDSLGYRQLDQIEITLVTILSGIINDSPDPFTYVLVMMRLIYNCRNSKKG